MNISQIPLYFRLENQAKISGEPRSQPKARQRLWPSVFQISGLKTRAHYGDKPFCYFLGTKSKKKPNAMTNWLNSSRMPGKCAEKISTPWYYLFGFEMTAIACFKPERMKSCHPFGVLTEHFMPFFYNYGTPSGFYFMAQDKGSTSLEPANLSHGSRHTAPRQAFRL